MAHKKGQGTSRNGRDSNAQRLGFKAFGGQLVPGGTIIVRQRGTRVKPGLNVGRGNKILVFHYKRKKQYKKLRGHRQDYTAVRITEIAVDGQSFKAPELAKKKVKKAAEGAPEVKASGRPGKTAKKVAEKKPVAKKAAAKKKKK